MVIAEIHQQFVTLLGSYVTHLAAPLLGALPRGSQDYAIWVIGHVLGFLPPLPPFPP